MPIACLPTPRLLAGVCSLLALALPAPAAAALDVTRDAASGGLRVASDGDEADAVTIERTAAGALRIHAVGGATSSTDAACTADEELHNAVSCALAPGAVVGVALGPGNDMLDARAATGVTMLVDGGPGQDTFRIGATGTAKVADATSGDVIDLSHAQGALRVRFERARARLVARCGGCPARWAVQLPAHPGRVVLGAHADDVDLVAWRAFGRTSWQLGADGDRFFGSPVHRSIVDAGADGDSLVSRTAVDVLRGGAGVDRLADFGGTGDLLAGGGDTDALASLDGRRDVIDGQAGRDLCLTARGQMSGCDTGPVRSVETAQYQPITTLSFVLSTLGVS